jgi:hypothetical protein
VPVLRDVAYSIWKPATYAEFVKRGGRRAFVYLLVIALPLAITGAVRSGSAVHWACESASRAVAGGPDFRIVNGLLEFEGPEPYTLTVEGVEIGRVDTTGVTDESYLESGKSGVLFLRDRAVVQNGFRRQEMPYAALGGSEPLTRAGLVGTVLRFGGLAWPIALLWLIGSVAGKLLAALVLSLGALAILSARGRAGGWAAAWVVAAHALTLPLLLGFVRVLSGASIAAFGLLYWGAAIVYCVAGTSSLPPLAPKDQSAAGPPLSG